MENEKSVKSFIKRHGAEIALGASCVVCGVVGYKLGVKVTTNKFMNDLREKAGEELIEEMTQELIDIATDAIQDSVL